MPPPSATPARASHFASHLFIPAGQSRSIDGLGRLLEIIHLTEPGAVSVKGTTLTAVTGGLSCLRLAYRSAVDENKVQTLCVVSFDETGDCAGLPTIRLDLQGFLKPTKEPVGNANLLESGDGLFYATCKTSDGAYRLQQPGRILPPLYLTIVDALGEGPYSLGTAEQDMQRNSKVVTYSGDELRPPWIVSVSMEIGRLRLTEDLRVEFHGDDCDVSPACTKDPDIVQPGDILQVSAGISPELLMEAFKQTSEDLRDRFFMDHAGVRWSEVAAVHPDAQRMAFNRLLVLDLMTELIRYFDDLYALREKGVIVSYGQPWPASGPLPFPYACFPDSIKPGETERCVRIEKAIQAAEARRIGALREAGYNLWYAGSVDYREGGEYVSLNSFRPHFSIFNGVLAGVGANSTFPVEDVPAVLANSVRQFAAEIGPEMPVILHLNGPPITAQTGGPPCEAQVCPSDFKGMYELAEATLHAALQSLNPQQFVGFGVSLFDGSHFDLRDPYENFPGFSLNRVGETGYNNPALNIYRAQ
jgi:hypothetical protein